MSVATIAEDLDLARAEYARRCAQCQQLEQLASEQPSAYRAALVLKVRDRANREAREQARRINAAQKGS